MKTGRNAPCPCGSGKKYKKCHASPEADAQREREVFGSFGRNPLLEAAARRPSKDLRGILDKIRAERQDGTRAAPSGQMLSIGDNPPQSVREFLVDACARIADQNWCGRSEMCIYFAVLLRHGLNRMGYAADVEVGKGEYFYGQPNPFVWDHAWVKTASADIVDANIDSVVENPMVPIGVKPQPYWGPDAQVPHDRRLKPLRTLAPERDHLELEKNVITEWKLQLDRVIDEWLEAATA